MPARRSAGSDTIALTVNEVAETRDALDDHHEHERQEQRDHGNGGERRRETELEEAEDLHRDRYLARSSRKSERFTSVNECTKANTAPATMPLLIKGNTM